MKNNAVVSGVSKCFKNKYLALGCIVLAMVCIYHITLYVLGVGKLSFDWDVQYGVAYPSKIFVINLDRSKERRELIAKQFEELNLEYTRFSAIDGYSVKIKNLESKEEIVAKDLKQRRDSFASSQGYEIFCTPEMPIRSTNLLPLGAVGCACSHIVLWDLIRKNGYQSAIILEDDAVLDVDFKNKLRRLVNNTPSQADLVYLNEFIYVSPKRLELNIFNPATYRLIKPFGLTTISYLITSHGVAHLRDLTKVISQPIDLEMSEATTKLNFYKARDSLVKLNRSLISDIGEMG